MGRWMIFLGLAGLLAGCASAPQGTDVGGLFSDPGKALEDPAKKPKVRPKTDDTAKAPTENPPVVEKAPEKKKIPPATALLSAQLSEDAQLRPLIQVVLNGTFSAKQTRDPGFGLSGGLKVLEVLDSETLRPGFQVSEGTSVVFLRFEGTLEPGILVKYGTWESGVEVKGLEKIPGKSPVWDPGLEVKIPQILLPGHPQWVEAYQGAWAWLSKTEPRDPWHRVLAPLALVYGDPAGAQVALDRLYQGQSAEGDIPGLPPLLAWAEWKYVQVTGDRSRLAKVLGPLDLFHQAFIKKYGSSMGVWLTDDLAGVPGPQREKTLAQGTWVDGSAQVILSARCMEDLARWAQRGDLADRYAKEFSSLREKFASGLWDRDTQTYRDKQASGSWDAPGHLGSFWALTAGIPPQDRGRLLTFQFLGDGKPWNFFTPGGSKASDLWPPLIYAVIQGLETYAPSLAFPAAKDFLDRVSQVYLHFDPQNSPLGLAPLDDPAPRRGDGLKQFWETYSGASITPGPRKDGKYLSTQAAGAYGGLVCVNLLLESVLGLQVFGGEARVRWAPRLQEVQGFRDLRVGSLELTGIYDPRRKTLEGRASGPLTLELVHPQTGRLFRAPVPQGRFLFNIE